MPLYIVELQTSLVVSADSPQKAEEAALGLISSPLERDDFSAFAAREVTTAADLLALTESWTLGCIPFGTRDNRTIGDYLGASAKTETVGGGA